MLMGEDEYQTAPLKKGDFVRYSPHGKNHNAPKIDTPESWAYWRLYGCIQVLCRVGDKTCFSKYKSGIFDHETGASINNKTNKVDLSVKGINPHSYLPQK